MLLPLLALLLLSLAAGCGASARGGDRAPFDWGIAYYLPYDNDLGRYSEAILGAIRAGADSERLVAAAQVDLPGAGGMRRVVFRRGERTETAIPSDDSADEEQALAYLRWFAGAYRCARYAVVFLDHGGRLDEMCRDDHPETPGKTWMSGQALGDGLRALRAEMPGRWELFFLQQCGRASLENLYSFRGTADYVLASPGIMLEPNTYYATLQRWLAATPDATGDQIAARIAAEDRDYLRYTCVRAEALAELPARLDAALAPLLAQGSLASPALLPAVYAQGGESLVGALEYLHQLAARNGVGEPQAAAFAEWVNTRLLSGTWIREGSSGAPDQPLGFFVPVTASEAGRYAHLDLYRETRLPALWGRLADGR